MTGLGRPWKAVSCHGRRCQAMAGHGRPCAAPRVGGFADWRVRGLVRPRVGGSADRGSGIPLGIGEPETRLKLLSVHDL